MNVRRLLLEALDSRWHDFRAARKACRKNLSSESVHDLRVAARRLLAFVALLRTAAPDVPAKRLRKPLKAQLHAFDALRDTQVMRSALSCSPFNQPELAPLRKRLERKEKRLRALADEQLRSQASARGGRRISALRKSLASAPVSPRLVLAAIDRAFGRAVARSARLPPLRPASIHRLRIAFKKFRYQTEVAVPAMCAFPEALPRRMHDFQSAMGEVQDAEVLRRALAGRGCSAKTARLAARRLASALAAFDATRTELATFWRADPRAAFPWEEPDKRGSVCAPRREAPLRALRPARGSRPAEAAALSPAALSAGRRPPAQRCCPSAWRPRRALRPSRPDAPRPS